MKAIGFILSMAFSIGCASIHQGKYSEESKNKGSFGAKADSLGLIVSGEENRRLASQYLTAFDFTFENTTSKWIRVKEVSVDFGGSGVNGKVNVLVGRDLIAWSDAAQQRAAIHDYNVSLALSVVTAAAVVGSSRGSGTGGDLATLTAIGAGSALTVNEIRTRLRGLELAKLVPDTHLYSGEFVIPPGLHAKKWIAVYTPDPFGIPYVDHLVVKIKTADGKEDSSTIRFRDAHSPSDWQTKHPDLLAIYKKEREQKKP